MGFDLRGAFGSVADDVQRVATESVIKQAEGAFGLPAALQPLKDSVTVPAAPYTAAPSVAANQPVEEKPKPTGFAAWYEMHRKWVLIGGAALVALLVLPKLLRGRRR